MLELSRIPSRVTILSAAPVKLQDDGGGFAEPAAKKKKLPRGVKMRAYSGAIFDVGFGPSVVDLEGMEIPAGGVPYLLQHDPSVYLGRMTEMGIVDGNYFDAQGFLFEGDSAADAFAKRSDQGANYQASMGFDVDFQAVSFVDEDLEVQVNGQTKTGPFLLFKKTKLAELSAVVRGADPSTATIALADAGKHNTEGSCSAQGGKKLGAFLRGEVKKKTDSGGSHEQIVEDVAKAAGIQNGTVSKILSGVVGCPPLERLQAFSKVLGTPLAAIKKAAAADGCSYKEAKGTKQMATVQELSAAFPGEDSFVLECLVGDLTVEAAQAKFNGVQAERLKADRVEHESEKAQLALDRAALEAERVEANKPNPTAALTGTATGSATGNAPQGGDPISDWETAMGQEVTRLNAMQSQGAGRGGNLRLGRAANVRAQAGDNLSLSHPGLHTAYLEAHNTAVNGARS